MSDFVPIGVGILIPCGRLDLKSGFRYPISSLFGENNYQCRQI